MAPRSTPQPGQERKPEAIPERALYRVTEAAILLSLSRSAIYQELRAGRLQSVCRGRSRLIPASAINVYVELLINESEAAHDQAA